MIPTGIERDKQIAELRGEVCHHPYRRQIGCTVRKPSSEICEDQCGCLFYNIKPYSTDISATMELWEEMKYEFAEIELTWVREDEQYLMRTYLTNGDADGGDWAISIRESLPAGTISGAYLKWKEG